MFDPIDAVLPQLAFARFLPCRADLRAVNLQVQFQPRGQFVCKAVGLGKKVLRVDHDDRNLRPLLRHHVEQNGRLHAKAGGEHDVRAKAFQHPAHAVLGGDLFEPGTDFAQGGFARRDFRLDQFKCVLHRIQSPYLLLIGYREITLARTQ